MALLGADNPEQSCVQRILLQMQDNQFQLARHGGRTSSGCIVGRDIELRSKLLWVELDIRVPDAFYAAQGSVRQQRPKSVTVVA